MSSDQEGAQSRSASPSSAGCGVPKALALAAALWAGLPATDALPELLPATGWGPSGAASALRRRALTT